MTTTSLTTLTNLTNTTGLSNTELDAELLNELPEREEMSGCHRWYNYWHPCHELISTNFHSSSTFVTSYSNTTSVGTFIR